MDMVERYFRALGWERKCITLGGSMDWRSPNGVNYGAELPNILEHFPSFKKWVLEEMEKRGYKLVVSTLWSSWYAGAENPVYETKIKDNEVLEAAIIAATNYLEGEKG